MALKSDIQALTHMNHIHFNNPYAVLLHALNRHLTSVISCATIDVMGLQLIDAESSENVLRFVMEKEAVHPYSGGIGELKSRLEWPNKVNPLKCIPECVSHPRSFSSFVLASHTGALNNR